MTPKQKHDDLYDQLKVVADVSKHPILDMELRMIAGVLAEYHGIELARLIASIPDRRYFPAAIHIEDEIRATLCLPPKDRGGPGFAYRKNMSTAAVYDSPSRKGPSEELIAKHEQESVVSGQKPERARAGAEIMRKSRAEAGKRAADRKAVREKVQDGGCVEIVNAKTPEVKPEIAAALVASVAVETGLLEEDDAMRLLEDFDRESIENDLDSF